MTQRQTQRELLEELLQMKEEEIGSPSPQVREWAAEIFREAETMAANERGAEDHDRGAHPEGSAPLSGSGA